MDWGNSPLFSGTKIKLIALVVAEKNISKFQDYKKILVFILWTVNFKVLSTSNEHSMSLSHLWWTHCKVMYWLDLSHGGYFTKVLVGGVQHAMKQWTKSDLMFCKNERSKRSKNNEKWGQQNKKSRRKWVQNVLKWSNDRDNLFFCRKRRLIRSSWA